MSIFSLRTALTLAGATLAVGLATPASAQAPNNDLARCQALYAQWVKYNGGSSYSKQLGADSAAEQCRKGETTAGIADLTRILQGARIPVPQTETATTK
jgi:hypothetical protein